MEDRDDAPRYALRSRLRDMVANARVGDRLPSERELSLRWGAARMTVRHAMDALVAEGLVVRRHGSGTYVVPKPFARVIGLTSFTQDMAARGLVASSRMLEFATVPADEQLASSLRIGLGDRVVTFTRLRFGSGEAMAVETVWIPAPLVPGLVATDLDGSLYELLARRYRVVTGAAKVRIEPVLPDAATRDLLAIAGDQACLRIRMVDEDARGRVIMLASCVYRGDKYQLSADVTGVAFAAAVPQRRAG